MNNKNINILGTNYKFFETENEFEEEIEHKAGITKFFEKEIYVLHDKDNEEDVKRVRMHEFIHAFFYEAGLLDYAQDETLTDFLAVQMPKLVKLYKIALEKNTDVELLDQIDKLI